MSPVSALLAVFTLVLEWFIESLGSVVSIFWVAETGFTFIGSITGIGFAIAVVLMVIAMVRSLIRARG